MEYSNSVLYENVFIVVVETFCSVAVSIVADCAVAASFCMVAVCFIFCSIFVGIYVFVISS